MSNIGNKRERVRFVRLAKVRRTDGGYDVSSTTLAERWAEIKPVRATESEQAGRKRGAVTYLITMPRYDDATTEDSLVWLTRGSAPLNIREIRRDAMRPLEMIVIAESGVVQ